MHDSSGRKIRVFLIDDHPIVREGFARALTDAPDIVVVGQAETAADALKEAPFTSPDVILVDLNMPDRDGIELIGALHARMPDVKLLVLSAYDDEFRVAEALRAGAHGYLVKTSKMDEVIDGIRRLFRGTLHPEVLVPHVINGRGEQAFFVAEQPVQGGLLDPGGLAHRAGRNVACCRFREKVRSNGDYRCSAAHVIDGNTVRVSVQPPGCYHLYAMAILVAGRQIAPGPYRGRFVRW